LEPRATDRNRRANTAAALAVLLAAAAQFPAAAETRLYVLIGGAPSNICGPTQCEAGQLLEIDVDAQSLVRATSILHARDFSSPLRVTADGRFLLWVGAESFTSPKRFSLFDAVTRGQTAAATLGGDAPYRLIAHPTVLKAFLQGAGDILLAEPGSIRTLPISSCVQAYLSHITANGDRLFVRCSPGLPAPVAATAVVDTVTGARVATVSETSAAQTSSADGSQLFGAEAGAGPAAAPRLRRWTVATNTLAVEREVGAPGDRPGRLTVDPRTGLLWIPMVNGSDGALEVVDPSDLRHVARVTTRIPVEIAFDPHEPRAVVSARSDEGRIRPSLYYSWIHIVDTDNFAVTLTAELPFLSGIRGIALAPVPPRPSSLSASVTRHDVTLQWQMSSGAPGSMTFVDAGTAPGLANVASIAVAAGATTLAAQSVPPGTYHVRVRTRTAGGVESVSNEITVIVRP
jgi:hypothetical protein